jgi:hypothetical protein
VLLVDFSVGSPAETNIEPVLGRFEAVSFDDSVKLLHRLLEVGFEIRKTHGVKGK